MSDAEQMLTEAQRALTRQEGAVDTIRTRAVGVVVGSGITAGLFAGRLNVATNTHRVLLGIAAVAFALGIVFLVGTLMPREMNFAGDLRALIDQLEDRPRRRWRRQARTAADGTACLRVATSIYEMIESNRDVQASITAYYTAACISFGVQVVVWLLIYLSR